MTKLNQHETPLFDALRAYAAAGTVSFHVPGHKHGEGIREFTEFVGKNVMNIDLTIMSDLDSICNPLGNIKKAQDLAAEAFNADYANFLVNGTSSGIQAMIMTVCEPGDKIIVPRNAHKSVIGGIILSGAEPIYIQPEINNYLGFAMGITPESVRVALHKHPDAKAVFVINPTYYGVASDLERIVEIAHSYHVPVIVDEAHGAIFHFHPDLPVSAMDAGADLSASSTHKLAGSMTQSSMLLVREGLVSQKRVKAIMNLTQTTSPSYVLLASLDAARKQMALHGREMLDNALRLARAAREELNQVEGLYVFGDDLLGTPGFHSYDPTKLVVTVRDLGLTGYETEYLLRHKYNIQVELADLYNVLAYITIGDTAETVSRFVNAMKDIAKCQGMNRKHRIHTCIPPIPELVVSPREAFYSDTKSIPLKDAEGEISAEMIMAYPPGIPLVTPGERITRELIDHVMILKNEEVSLQGTEDPRVDYIRVLARNFMVIPGSLDEMQSVG